MISPPPHMALIPAKAYSSRCPDKNWREFFMGAHLVSYVLERLPQGLFSRIIVSTDKPDFLSPAGVTLHKRDPFFATVASPVNDLISRIIEESQLPDHAYLWLLNPTSPFREEADFQKISEMIENENPDSVVSVCSVNPFLWKNAKPMFKTSYPRINTQDNPEEYALENGQFYVFKAGFFRQTQTWYSEKTLLYRQNSLGHRIDIDTENDFAEAQNWAGVIHGKK